jgi:integrase
MGQIVPPGLIKRKGIWHIQKRFGDDRRLRESTGTSDLKEAERYLAHRIEEIRNAEIYGIRPKRTFREAAIRYLDEATKSSIDRDAHMLKILDPYIGGLTLKEVHMGTLQPYIHDRMKAGMKKRTINYGLAVVRHIMRLAADDWIDMNGLTWIDRPPKIRLFKEDDRTDPYPLDWSEQEKLFAGLPLYLRHMALFAVNTGCRDQEICKLKWDWEIEIPELETIVFLIPKEKVKNREDRLVVMNSIARGVIDDVRGEHEEFVFTYKGKPIQRMYNRAWRQGRERAGLPRVRVHDLKHTFGRRLRAVGVNFEDRQDLLGHKSSRMTTHYSAPELISLMQASERVCRRGGHKSDTIIMLKKKSRLVAIGN